MCDKQDRFDSYRIYPNRHRCDPCSFHVRPSGLISPSYNPPGDYPEGYKAGWEWGKRESNLPCHDKIYPLPRIPMLLRGIAEASSFPLKEEEIKRESLVRPTLYLARDVRLNIKD